MRTHELPSRRPGRPKLGAERRVRYCVCLEPTHDAAELLRMGSGNLSAGIRKALEESRAWRAHCATPETGTQRTA